MYLTGDEVIAATKDTMDDTMQYISDKYGSADKYLRSVRPCLFHAVRAIEPASLHARPQMYRHLHAACRGPTIVAAAIVLVRGIILAHAGFVVSLCGLCTFD